LGASNRDLFSADCTTTTRGFNKRQGQPWLDTLMLELLGFPNARHDDQVDSVSQFLSWASRPDFFAANTIAGAQVKVFVGGVELNPQFIR
jgi:hypothetical protein